MYQHFRCHSGLLDHASVRSQVAEQDGNAAGGHVGVVHGSDDLRVQVVRMGDILGHGLASAGHHIGVEQTGVCQLLHNGVDAAGTIQVLHIGESGGRQVAQVGGLGGDLVGVLEVQLDTALVGDRGQMEHGVGGAAQGHIHGLGVVEGFRRHDVSGTDVLLDQLHHLHPSHLGQTQTGRVGGGDGAVAGQTHANGFGQAVHGVGGIHTGTAAAAGTGVLNVFLHACFIQRASVIGAHRLKHMAQTGAAAIL